MHPVTVVSSDRPHTLVERLALDRAREPLSFRASFVRALADSSAAPAADSTGALARASTTRDDDPFGRDALTWRIYDLLNGDLCQQAGFETHRAFIMEGSSRDARSCSDSRAWSHRGSPSISVTGPTCWRSGSRDWPRG